MRCKGYRDIKKTDLQPVLYYYANYICLNAHSNDSQCDVQVPMILAQTMTPPPPC